MQIAKTVEIDLRDGQVMTLDMTPELLKSIRASYMLDSDNDITESHIKNYLATAIKNLLEAQENVAK